MQHRKAWHLSRVLRRMSVCEQGSIATTFVFALLALAACAGAAVDIARVTRLKSHMQSQLDAATIGAVQQADNASVEAFIEKYFAATSTPESIPVQTSVTTNDGMKVVAVAQADIPMSVTRLIGQTSMRVEVKSTATKLAGHMDIYIAVDLSSSLGMAATDEDRIKLENLTKPYTPSFYGTRLPQGCAFGCHRREGWEPDGKTVYQLAKEAGIKLREDELNSQFNGLIDLLLDTNDPAVAAGLRRISVFGFSNRAQRLISDSSTPASIRSSLAAFADGDRWETDFAAVLNELEYQLGTQGSGSQSAPKKMFVLITDGIESRDAFFAQSEIKTSLCQSIKAKGFRLAVVELKYPVLTGNALYDDTVKPVKDKISPALQACASDGWYFQAVNNTDVPEKFKELTKKISLGSVRISE